MIIETHNEWDKLNTVVLGDITGARFPKYDDVFDKVAEGSTWTESAQPKGPISATVIQKTQEELEFMKETFEQAGVKVVRPRQLDFQQVVHGYRYFSDGMYNYCPRDVILIIGNYVIESPSLFHSRHHECEAYRDIRYDALARGCKWISAPNHALPVNEVFDEDGNLTEKTPIFDAANVMRFGKDILYLKSQTGNEAGARWLSTILGKEYTVHIWDKVYAFAHIDSTIAALNEETILVNKQRIGSAGKLPKFLKDKKKIWVNESMIEETEFHVYPYASKWIGMNVLSIDPNTVMVDPRQKKLIKRLEKEKFDIAPVQLTHSRTLGGGHHCVTLDLHRG
jgi:scyllo-inosamine-4-phosphate amidinotransferase 1|tara:strand:+ start:83 stop:1096 length:1014 start_codon:yes stop_codon:yes gene_type:complete